jgi:hypothetical protein
MEMAYKENAGIQAGSSPDGEKGIYWSIPSVKYKAGSLAAIQVLCRDGQSSAPFRRDLYPGYKVRERTSDHVHRVKKDLLCR